MSSSETDDIAKAIFGSTNSGPGSRKHCVSCPSSGHRLGTIVIDDDEPVGLMTDEQREKLQRIHEKMMREPQPRGMIISSPSARSMVEEYYRTYPHLRYYHHRGGKYEQRRMASLSLVVKIALTINL